MSIPFNHSLFYDYQPNISVPLEVHENIETKVVILNQDGTLSEELMFPNGINLETIEDLSVHHDIISSRREMVAPSLNSSPPSCYPPSLQKPQCPVSVGMTQLRCQTTILQNLRTKQFQTDHTYIKPSQIGLLGQNKIFVLPDGPCLMESNENNAGFTTFNPSIGNSLPVDFSWPIDPSLSPIEIKSQVSLETRKPLKRCRVKFLSKGNSLGSLGQVLQGLPKDPKLQSVQTCPLCKFEAATKNPYRHLQDHLARVHFKGRLTLELPSVKPYLCPVASCGGKQFPDWQAVMRHYIGNRHGVLQRFVREELIQEGIGGLTS